MTEGQSATFPRKRGSLPYANETSHYLTQVEVTSGHPRLRCVRRRWLLTPLDSGTSHATPPWTELCTQKNKPTLVQGYDPASQSG